MILVIDNYDSFTYNLVQLCSALGAEVEVRRNDAISAEQALALEPTGIVVSPGPGTPDDAGISRDVIRAAAADTVCRCSACVWGTSASPRCSEAACAARRARCTARPTRSPTTVAACSPACRAPSPRRATTRCASTRRACREVLEVQATTADGVVMALRHRELPVFGVQFHPESVLTPEGAKLLANFLDVAGEVPLAGEASGTPQVVAAAGGSARISAEAAQVASVAQAIARVAAGESLTEDAAYLVMDRIMDGEATPAQISALVVGMRMKGETVDEIVGFARAMREHATPVRPRVSGLIDTCGTGGDGLHTFNISTTTAFVVAGAGVPVAKHGNRAVSSAAGSADVLEALGVDISLDANDMARCIDEAGVGFLFAQSLHSSMRHAGPVRREIGIRTVFNILGPLTNPAGATRQLLGVYDPRLAPLMAEVAGRLGAQRVLVVNGHPGMDEVSASGPTTVAEFSADTGGVEVYEIVPEQVGIARGTLADIAGGTAAENADIVRWILEGEVSPRRDVVTMNAAAALLAAGKATDLAEGVALARESIDSGRALAALERLVAVVARGSVMQRGNGLRRVTRELPRRHDRGAPRAHRRRVRTADARGPRAAGVLRALGARLLGGTRGPKRRRGDRRGEEELAFRRRDRSGLRGFQAGAALPRRRCGGDQRAHRARVLRRQLHRPLGRGRRGRRAGSVQGLRRRSGAALRRARSRRRRRAAHGECPGRLGGRVRGRRHHAGAAGSRRGRGRGGARGRAVGRCRRHRRQQPGPSHARGRFRRVRGVSCARRPTVAPSWSRRAGPRRARTSWPTRTPVRMRCSWAPRSCARRIRRTYWRS